MFSSNNGSFLYLIFLQIIVLARSDEYKVVLTTNAPAVRGATVHFTASLFQWDELASGRYEFIWLDNAMPSPHSAKVTSDQPVISWDVIYDKEYPPGEYEVQVIVQKYFLLIPYKLTSARLNFMLTGTLNGELVLTQENVTRDTQFISTMTPLLHSINLTAPDAKYISNATSITTFWFIDCIYYGPTNDGKFSHIFPVSGEEHTLDVLMIADFNPPPPPPTTTTSTTTTIKPTSIKTTVKPNMTSEIPTTSLSVQVPASMSTAGLNITSKTLVSSNSNLKILQKRSVNVSSEAEDKKQNIKVNVNGTLVSYKGNFPYVCNGTVAEDQNMSYGYFSRKIIAKAPISSVDVKGNNWLQHGDILTLNVLCDGSPSLGYCVQFKKGSYNATGNETCDIYLSLDTCSFLIQRYLGESTEHTVIIIIKNDVTKVVKSVGITVYKVKKQAQLSIIVVPVAFSLVAVVLIVFGVAYYIQNRRRFIVEVADFNFGIDYSDMEYKTFRERLQESFVNAFTRAPSPEPSEAPHWPQGQNQKYGSMT
ncbi:hypothetical protein HHI36_018410 [Cryptolaemus montrouzieri]|uniref:Transmembrane protein n=1 Tax=Cryptolaemus montrouzieri TaxID=559131 RepID=A0ABD2P0R5_9CUCU